MGVACKIWVNKAREGVHRAGKRVTGVVKYAIDEPTDYTDVILSLIGEGRCSWTERESGINDDSSKSTTYIGMETYVKRHLYMLDKLPGVTVTLPFGSYEYPFEFYLPQNIPPSFKDDRCTISYRVEVKFAKPGFFSWNKDFHLEIPVYGHVEHACPHTPIMFGVDKCLFKPFSSYQQEVKLKAEIAQACLLPGQNVSLSFDVTNNTDIDLTSIKSDLVCTTVYTANCGRQKSRRQSIMESIRGTVSIPPKTVAKLSTLMPIQANLYSIQHSSVLRKSYEIVVSVMLPWPHLNASVSVPVVIGERVGQELCIDDLEIEEPADQPPSYKDAMNEYIM